MHIILSTIDNIYNWARSNSLWPLTFATSCCGIEMMSATASNFDIARFGSEVFRASPRQADLLIIAGSVVYGADKIIPVDIYLPMCPPKPEALIDAIKKLQNKIKQESLIKREAFISSHKTNLHLKDDLDILTLKEDVQIFKMGL